MYQEVIETPGGSKKTRIVHFDSLDDYVTPRMENPRCKELFKENVDNQWREMSPGKLISWFGCATKEEFSETLNVGHPKYVKLVEEQMINLPPPERMKRRKLHGNFGDEVCVHKINSGNISQAWSRKSPRLKLGIKNVKLIVNIGNHSGITAEQMKWPGVVALRVANALELSGYAVAIDLFQASTDVTNLEHQVQTAPIKTYEQRMDIQALSSVVCFSGFFRGPGFINKGHSEGKIDYFLGSPMDNGLQKDVIKRCWNNPVEAIEFIARDTLTKEAADKAVMDILKRYSTEGFDIAA
jgi:hypothetical protein